MIRSAPERGQAQPPTLRFRRSRRGRPRVDRGAGADWRKKAWELCDPDADLCRHARVSTSRNGTTSGRARRCCQRAITCRLHSGWRDNGSRSQRHGAARRCARDAAVCCRHGGGRFCGFWVLAVRRAASRLLLPDTADLDRFRCTNTQVFRRRTNPASGSFRYRRRIHPPLTPARDVSASACTPPAVTLRRP
jgi:hypothetical protein